MAEFSDRILPQHEAMMGAQSVFFVATAAADARINLSPKGYDSFRVLGPNRVAYLDLAGSGNETHAHVVASGRITVMAPLILRLYGTCHPVLPQHPEWEELAAHFTILPGTRQIFDITVNTVQTSCGWGVPVMSLEVERLTLVKYHAQSDETAWMTKTSGRNRSIDGLPTTPTDRFFRGN